jgi:UDP-glucose 4-epimerase
VRVCEQVLGRTVEVEVDPERLRAKDRAELVADPRLIQGTTGWKAQRSLRDTLNELLSEPTPTS